MNQVCYRSPRRQFGLTLVESLVTLAVSAVALGAAVPGFEQVRERRQLESIAAQLETDIQHARSLAVARGASVRMSFEADAQAVCYVVHTGNAGECSCTADGQAVCSGTAQALQSTRWNTTQIPVRLASNSRSILFDAARGTVTPTATIKLQSDRGSIHQVVNIMGRVRSCSPASAVPGYRGC